MGGALAAVGLLTRVPVGHRAADAAARAAPWFPVVGAAIGGVVAAVYAVAHLALPPLPSATLAVAAGVLLTGAFHEDGLADVADATGGWTVEDRYRILADPTHGTYGVLALVLSVVARVAALAVLSPAVGVGALVAAHALARAAAVALMAFGPTAGEGLGARYAKGLRHRDTALASLAGVAAAGVGLRWWAAAAVGLALLVVLVLRRWCREALGGVTGDVLGASEQLVEIATLLLVGATAT